MWRQQSGSWSSIRLPVSVAGMTPPFLTRLTCDDASSLRFRPTHRRRWPQSRTTPPGSVPNSVPGSVPSSLPGSRGASGATPPRPASPRAPPFRVRSRTPRREAADRHLLSRRGNDSRRGALAPDVAAQRARGRCGRRDRRLLAPPHDARLGVGRGLGCPNPPRLRGRQRACDALRGPCPPPRPHPRTNRTRRVTPPVLIGHATSLPPY
jgi:hypothetical protein